MLNLVSAANGPCEVHLREHGNDFGPRSEAAKREVLRVCCQREVSYAIVHSKRHVFHPEETALAEMVDGRPALVLVDKNIWQLFGRQLSAYTALHLKCLGKVTVHGSERRKDWGQVQRICSHALRLGLPRDGVMVAFGGGVTLDLSGMAASLYRRGVAYVRVPTTLVGIVDTAVGIKHGFNFKSRKNILGTFYPPIGVINDVSFLATLTERELSCGLAEIIKMGVVRDATLLTLLEQNAEALLQSRFQSPVALAMQVLLRAERVMIEELQPNLFEKCQARLPDFGHTFSQGLERASGYEMRHGHAVALDMLLSTGIAVRHGLCSKKIFERMACLYRASGLPLTSSVMTPELLLASARDARLHRSGDLNLVVPIDFGRATYLQEVGRDDLEYSLAMMEQSADEQSVSRCARVGV